MDNARSLHLQEIPPPEAKEPGWYPDPLGSTAERYWDGTWLELVRVPKVRLASQVPHQNGQRPRARRRGLRLPLTLIGLKPSAQAPAEEPTRDKAEEKRSREVEARKQEFFESPAGKARLSFGQRHRVFQCELELAGLEPVIIPGVEGAAPSSTADPVAILNSVVVEGWKLVAGTFVYAEVRGGPVGFYLFKRSKKRYRKMNDPWKSDVGEDLYNAL